MNTAPALNKINIEVRAVQGLMSNTDIVCAGGPRV